MDILNELADFSKRIWDGTIFVGQPRWALFVIVAISLYVLMKGADWLVDGAAGFAYRMGLPKVIVGATIVALGTTAPECAVSVMAAWNDKPDLALGNAVGSIICDTGMIFGLGCLLVVLPADRFILTRQGWVQFSAAALLAVICYVEYWINGNKAKIEQWVGVLFLGLLVAYMYASFQWSKQQVSLGLEIDQDSPVQNASVADDESTNDKAKQVSIGEHVISIVVGLALVIVSCHILIDSAAELAEQLGVPHVVISSTLIAFGTSLPELVVAISAIRRGHYELLIGNVIGADILNVLFVIGASATAKPLPIPLIFLKVSLPAMLAILVLFRIFILLAYFHFLFF